ncbi:MAG: glutamate racemase [Lachnospiraceae bacterium]|nr:glutamate racemase [Lachnospiraceae bacterium]
MEDLMRPIGVFDSGVGGISVLRELVRLMPNENYIFYGDSMRAPYGSKTLEEVRQLTEEHVEELMGHHVKAVVIACNTATSADVSILRSRYPDIPIIGIEPALKPAVLCQENAHVLVLATPMTIREKKFQTLMAQYESQAQIWTRPCPDLVRFVERGEFSSRELYDYLNSVLADYRDKPVDAVVLGCTHFPFVKEAIRQALGKDVRFFDGGEGVARETRRRLQEMGELAPEDVTGQVQFINSDPDKLPLCQMLMESGKN